MPEYYRTNQNYEAVVSLEFVSELIVNRANDTAKWKWIIIALHNSLQNFMVCSLLGTNNLKVLAKKSALDWFAEFTNRLSGNVEEWKSPDEKLDYFPNLFNKIQSDLMLMYTVSQKFSPTESQKNAVINLNYLRNEFIHFVPKVWSINTDDLPNLVLEILTIIEFLVFESYNIVWIEDNYPARVREILDNIRNNIGAN